MKPLRVLSLFDGMSCLQIALKELGYPIEVYYASEVDKHAIAQTQLNFPDTIQLGDVRNVDGRSLGHIDLLGGGSPCTNFSFAGKRNGMNTTTNEEIYTLERYLQLKEEGLEFEGQSYLFWEYMRILGELREANPDVKFLLENVEMGTKWERVLSEAIGIKGVHINSALVSAQNRRRIYWTNIRTRQEGLFEEVVPDIPQPEDRGLLLKDILQPKEEVDKKYYLSERVLKHLQIHLEGEREKGNGSGMNPRNGDEKMNAVTVKGKGIQDLVKVETPANSYDETQVCLTQRRNDVGKKLRSEIESGRVSIKRRERTQLEPRDDGKAGTITTVHGDNYIVQMPRDANNVERKPIQVNEADDWEGQPRTWARVFHPEGIAPTLCQSPGGQKPLVILDNDNYETGSNTDKQE